MMYLGWCCFQLCS